MNAKFRVARATNDLERTSVMYQTGLGLQVLASFADHDGFDGVILGSPGCEYHFEFTKEKGAVAPRSHSVENLLVLYFPEPSSFSNMCNQMLNTGFVAVKAHNEYWNQNGTTFEDFEGYRIVISSFNWTK